MASAGMRGAHTAGTAAEKCSSWYLTSQANVGDLATWPMASNRAASRTSSLMRPVEAFDEGVLVRRSRLDEPGLSARGFVSSVEPTEVRPDPIHDSVTFEFSCRPRTPEGSTI